MLQGVGGVVDHGDAGDPAQHGEDPHVDHQVVIAERRPPLGEEDLRLPPRGQDLLHHPRAVIGGEELPLLDVDRPAGAGGRLQQGGLPGQERRHLQDVADLRRGRDLADFVDVGEDRHPGLVPDPPPDLQPFGIPEAGARIDRAAVRLAVRGFEDVAQAEPAGDLPQASGDLQRHRRTLQHAGAGDDQKLLGPQRPAQHPDLPYVRRARIHVHLPGCRRPGRHRGRPAGTAA